MTKEEKKEEARPFGKKNVVIVSIVLIIALSGVAIWQFMGSKPEPAPEEEVQTEEEVREILIRAVEASDKDICDEVNEEADRSDCVNQVVTSQAMIGGDSSKCDGAGSEEEVIRCKDSVVISRAANEGDKTICSETSSEPMKERCERIVDSVLEASE